MNPGFYRRDGTNQEMDSTLLSLLLMSLVFMQFVAATDQINSTITATVGDNLILPCKDPDKGEIIVVEWSRTDLGSEYVLLYRDKQINPGAQHPSYKNRADLLVGQMKVGDASLILRNTTTDDSGKYECRLIQTSSDEKLISIISLKVSPPPPPPPPDPLPVWAIILLVLLVLVLVAAPVLIFWLWHRFSVHKVKVDSGVESVLLPWRWGDQLVSFRFTSRLPEDVRVVWRDEYNRKVHVHQNGSDCSDEQNRRYRNRTKMDKNLSLTLKQPTCKDNGFYTCRVYSSKGDVLMEKDILLKVKVQEVEVESGVESVLLPCRTTESLDGDTRVEWMDSKDRTVHVYQDGSDHPEEQDKIYRTRTKMDENLLKTGDLSLTLRQPTYEDMNSYTCRVYSRNGVVLIMKDVWLQVKVQQVEVESGVESVELPCTITEDLDGDVRVEWRDGENRTVHVYQDGSDQLGDQHQIYRTRTKMDENLLRNKDLSLTLMDPTISNIFTCRVSNRDGEKLMMKQVQLEVKDQQVKVEEGAESVLLPFRMTFDLLGRDVVLWRDREERIVHMYWKGSDQPEEQNQIYKDRTRMDENLKETKDISLTLIRPTDEDSSWFRCGLYRDGDLLRMKTFQLNIKAKRNQDQPDDTRTRRNSIDPTPLMADQSV